MSADVKKYEITEEINEHNHLPLNPHPPYGLLTGYHCYPFLFYGSKQSQVTRRKAKILVAENEYLKIGMAPDYGGRLWFMYDKINKREVIHRVHTDAMIYNAGMGCNYMGGGLELNIPNAHSYTNTRKRFCAAVKNADGSASLVMSNTEKIGRIHWTVSFSLFPGEARVVQKVRLANETPFEERYLYWANCGIPVGENTEYIYSEGGGAVHGNFENLVSWPTFMRSNIAILKNIDGMFGLYMLGAREGYFGYYDHDEQRGLIHYADVNDLPGKKYWSWGWHESGQHTAYDHTDYGRCYGEIQSGRIIIQEEFDRMGPMTNAAWTEYWYPYKDIGIINGASPSAGINFEIAEAGKKSKAMIKAVVNRPFADASIIIRKNGNIIATCSGLKLKAGEPFAFEKEISATKQDQNDVGLELVDKQGGVIAAVLPKKDKPKKQDTYFVPDKLPVKTAQDFTAEGYFYRAEKLAREWMFHLPEIRSLFEESLRVDPYFSKPHAELGLLYLRVGEYQKAIEHFDQALNRIYDDARTLYYKGLAFWLSGNIKEAVYHLRQAGRFGYECQERMAEAQISVQRKAYAEALTHLDRALAVNGTVVFGHVLKALVLRRLNKGKEAGECLKRARQESPFSPFLITGEYLLADCSAAIRKKIQGRYRMVPEEILSVVSTLYLSGLADEALDVLNTMEISNDMVVLYRRRLAKETGRKMRSLPKRDPEIAEDFAWKLEDFIMLGKELAENPKEAKAHYHLGNLYYGRGFEEEGIKSWEKAYELGYRDKILFYEMTRAYRRKNEKEKSRRLLIEAYQADPDDPYIYDDYLAFVQGEKGRVATTAFIEKDSRRVKKYFSTASTLMRNYLVLGEYGKLEQLMAGMDFSEFWHSSFGSYCVILRLAQGYKQLSAKKYEEARACFEQALAYPASIGKKFFIPYPERARRLFYLGLCERYLGNEEKAKEHWEEALTLDQQATFELSYDFNIMKARYYQAFCLRGLGRFHEADVYIHGLKKLAQHGSLADSSKKALLRWAYLGQEKDITKVDRFDTELGITAFATMATSVES